MAQSQLPQLAMPIGVPVAASGDEDDVAATAVPLWDDSEKNFSAGALPSGGGTSGATGTFNYVTTADGLVQSGEAKPYILGNVGSTDNVLTRSHGTTADTIQGTGIVVEDNDAISQYKAKIVLLGNSDYTNVSGTYYYTLTVGLCGCIVDFTGTNDVVVLTPDTFAAGWCCTLFRSGSGAVLLQADGSATIASFSDYLHLSANGAAGLWVASASPAAYRLAGTIEA